MEAARIAALQRMPIFGGIEAGVLRLLVEQASSVRVPEGDYFFRQDDKAESMFVLEAGRVAIIKRWDGEEHLIARLGPGDCFGEMALMDLFPRSAGVRAETPCAAIELRVDSFLRLYQTDLEQFALIQMNLGREVSRRLRRADERLFLVRIGAAQTPHEGSEPLV